MQQLVALHGTGERSASVRSFSRLVETSWVGFQPGDPEQPPMREAKEGESRFP